MVLATVSHQGPFSARVVTRGKYSTGTLDWPVEFEGFCRCYRSLRGLGVWIPMAASLRDWPWATVCRRFRGFFYWGGLPTALPRRVFK
jgi:hypothetical protein